MFDSIGDQAGNAADPGTVFGVLAENLITSARTSGSWDRVGDHVTTNCGA